MKDIRYAMVLDSILIGIFVHTHRWDWAAGWAVSSIVWVIYKTRKTALEPWAIRTRRSNTVKRSKDSRESNDAA